ncbi:transposase [Spirosoma jeollabukense]
MAPATRLKRKRKHDLRQIINCILWLLRTGCQWRNLPDGWPHWQAVYYYFDQWKTTNLFERINATLNEMDRKRVNRMPTPSLVCIDSQTGPPERC